MGYFQPCGGIEKYKEFKRNQAVPDQCLWLQGRELKAGIDRVCCCVNRPMHIQTCCTTHSVRRGGPGDTIQDS